MSKESDKQEIIRSLEEILKGNEECMRLANDKGLPFSSEINERNLDLIRRHLKSMKLGWRLIVGGK